MLALPFVTALFVCAEPLTVNFFGDKWLEAVPLLRLESVTTLFGLALTPIVPLLFLSLDSRRVKWMMVASTGAVWLLGPLVAIVASFKAISIAQIVVAATLLPAIDLMLRARRFYSPIADMLPGLGGMVPALIAGAFLVSLASDAVTTLAVGAAVAAIQLGATILLGGAVDIRLVLARPERMTGPPNFDPPDLSARSAPPTAAPSD
jgi:O-antigen/teichoic acid export membrane protein